MLYKFQIEEESYIAKIKKIESSLAEKQRHTPSETYGLNSIRNQSKKNNDYLPNHQHLYINQI